MKKIFLSFFIVALCASNVFADDVVTASRAVPSSQSQVTETPVQSVVSRSTVSRGAIINPVVPTDINNSDNINGSESIIQRSGSVNQNSETTRSSGVSNRTTISRSVVAGGKPSQREKLEETVGTVGRSARSQSASINNNPAVRRAGLSLRPSTAEVGGRATIDGTDIQTGSNFNFNKGRSVQNRAAKTDTKESIADATERLKQTAELNKSCQQQYNDCMDQFCAVIDANQKRCSCSGNLSKYTKVETAVKSANSELNDVAQRIRYVGLSADEIRAIMSSTEAEDVLDGTKDNSESRNMLSEIEKLIKNPTSATSSSSGNVSTGLDMDLDFTTDSSSDLFNLDFLGNSSSSFSNLRGTDLYNAAKKRCNSVLTQCKTAGGTPQQITGNYDLAIDKDCIAYEQGLTKMNETLKSNVRSANQMLQKARLAVLQNKNQYDAKGCISALNTCMTDDMVCGSDYAKCLDPTKKYIDENGKVVLGQNISAITSFMDPTAYNNAAVNTTYLQTAMNANYSSCNTTYKDGSCVAKYLMQKIGTGQKVIDGGLCRAVLDKCQYYTYDSNGEYKPYNDVVVNYIQRAMVNIYAAQQEIISDYGSSCMVDIATCYNQQVSQVNAWSSTSSIDSVYNVMRGACRNVALTCSYAVFAKDTISCPISEPDTCINNISKMFYQSLLCPVNSNYYQSTTPHAISPNGTVAGYVNERCQCTPGYSVWSGTCSKVCEQGEYRNSLGVCTSCPAGTFWEPSTIDTFVYVCGKCEGGNYCPNAGTITQLSCTAGSYCPEGTATPILCPTDKPNSNIGSDELSDCHI
ncbi:MAG: hypothetical protein JW985_02840 [Alphaproteobacteria bacterium]|nr:hypothetical protein [Alphaproteobacteria bacterium]